MVSRVLQSNLGINLELNSYYYCSRCYYLDYVHRARVAKYTSICGEHTTSHSAGGKNYQDYLLA